MNESELRRARLKALIEHHGGAAAVARRLGHAGPSYLGQLLTGRAPLTDKAARKIEAGLEAPNAIVGEHKPAVPFENVDRALLADAIRIAGELAAREGVTLAPQKFALLASAAYEHAASVGRVDVDHVLRLLQLAR